MTISYTNGNVVCVEGDEELLEDAVEEELLYNDSYVVPSEDKDDSPLEEILVDDDDEYGMNS